MSREEYLTLCLARWEELQSVESSKSLYDLEKGIVEMVHGLGRDLLSSELGSKSSDRRKKKSTEQPWEGGSVKDS